MTTPSNSEGASSLSRRTLLSIAAAGGLMLLAGCGDSKKAQSLVGYQLDPMPQVGDLALPDVTADETPLTFGAPPGGLLLTFFGYTSCPDICPTTMATMSSAMKRLGTDRSSRVSVAMVTIDPTRDTPDRLAQYVAGSVPDGHGLRTEDDDALRAVTDRFGADYYVDPTGETEVSHTSTVYVVDDTGAVVLLWQFGVTAQDMENDLRMLLDGAA